jgi:TP901 family phage tail tape measure protein
MPTEVASLYATLALQDTMTSALRTARGGLNDFSQRLERAGSGITNFGSQMSLITAPLVAFGAASIGVASDFESSMAEIQARTGATADEMERLRQTSVQLGADTLFSAQDANDAFLQLLATGMSLDDAFAAIEPIMMGAMAAGGDLGQTTEAVTATLMGFNMEAEEAERVVNVMAQAAGASAATMQDMGLALSDVAGVAAGFGLTFEETAATLAVFSNAGITGAEAGTQLRSMLRNMYSDAGPTIDAWEALGVALYDAEGNLRPFTDVLQETVDALAEMTPEEQIAIINQIAGSYGLAGFNALLAANGIDEMQISMAESTDVATMADTMMNTFRGTMDSLGGSIEGVMINAFTPFMQDVLTPLASQAIELVNTFSDWAAQNPELTTTIIAITAAAALFFAALIPLGMIIGAVGTALAGIGAVIGFILSPVGLLIGGIVLLAAAFATNFEGIRDLVKPILSDIGNVINTVVLPAVDSMILGLVDLWTDIQPGLDAFKQWFVEDGLPLISQFINEIFIPAAQLIGEVVGGIWAVVEPALSSFFNWFMSEGLPAISDFLSTTVIPLISDFITILSTIWDVVSIGLLALHEWWQHTFVAEWIESVGGMQGVIDTIISTLQNIWTNVSAPLNDLFQWFQTNMPLTAGVIQEVINVINNIAGAVQTAIDAINNLTGVSAGISQNADVITEGVASGEWDWWQVAQAAGNAIGQEFGGGQAYGGEVEAGKSYMVGELGQERFTPATDGTITPNDELGGGQIQVNFYGGQAPRDEQEANNAAFMLVNSLRARGLSV